MTEKNESQFAKYLLITISVIFLFLFLVLPLYVEVTSDLTELNSATSSF